MSKTRARETAERSEITSRKRARAWLAVLLALVLGIAGCGGDDDGGDEGAQDAAPVPQETDTAEQPPAEDEPGAGNAAAGEAVFADNCSTCHGPDGGGGSGPSLQRAELAEDRGRITEQVINGGGGMPPFGDQLSDQQVADVTAYVAEEIAQR